MAEAGTLHDAFLDELRDSYDAEKQLIKALPKLAKAATSPQLKTAFESHLEETKGHVDKLERVFESLDEKVRGKHCDGIEGIIDEGKSIMGRFVRSRPRRGSPRYVGLREGKHRLSLLPDSRSFCRRRRQVAAIGEEGRRESARARRREDRGLSRSARQADGAIGRLHSHGLHGGVECGREHVGLSLPRIAVHTEGGRHLGPGGIAARGSIEVASTTSRLIGGL